MIIAKIIVFTVNFVLWASGIILIVFGGIALGSPSTIVNLLNLINGVSNITNIINVGNLLEGMAIFMIVDGSLLFLFGGIGCHGIHRMHKRLLMNYWLMLILGILVEIGVIIYGGVYPGTAQAGIQADMLVNLNTYFQPVTIVNETVIYDPTEGPTQSWQYLQTETLCCGANGPEDYTNNNFSSIIIYPTPVVAKFPPTCCTTTGVSAGQPVTTYSQFANLPACVTGEPTNSYIYQQGCYNVAMNMLWNFEYIAMIIAGCLIAVQILGTIFTVHTWHRMVKDSGI